MFWSLPGPSIYLERVLDALRSQKHVVLVIPARIRDKNPVAAVRAKVRTEGVGEVTRASVPVVKGVSPEALLCGALALSDAHLTMDEILSARNAPSRVVALDDLWGIDGEMREAWVHLLTSAGEHAQACGGAPFSLVALLDPSLPLPKENVFLRLVRWWGVQRLVDVECAVERYFTANLPRRAAETYWLRAACRGVACWDPDVAQMILEKRPLSVDDIVQCLGEDSNGIKLAVPPSTVMDSFVPYGHRVRAPEMDPNLSRLWKAGLVEWIDGSGIVVHSLALACHGGRNAIAKRLWQGQTEVLLPLVEHVRQAVLDWLNSAFGDTWIHLCTPDEGHLSGVMEEIGPLAHHAFGPKSPLRARNHPGFPTARSVALAWKGIRNRLAHKEVVPVTELSTALSRYEQFVRRWRQCI